MSLSYLPTYLPVQAFLVAQTVGLIPGSGRCPGEGNVNLLSVLAWRMPRTEEPGKLQSIGVTKSQT